MFPKLKVIVDFILSKISKDKKNLVSYTNLKKKNKLQQWIIEEIGF